MPSDLCFAFSSSKLSPSGENFLLGERIPDQFQLGLVKAAKFGPVSGNITPARVRYLLVALLNIEPGSIPGDGRINRCLLHLVRIVCPE